MIKKTIANWLYKEPKPVQEADMALFTRSILKGADKATLFDELPLDEQEKHLKNIPSIQNNPAFHFILDSLIARQVYLMATETKDVRELDFGRATIAGIRLVEDEIDRLNGLFLEMTEKNKSFDKFDVL